MYVVEVRWGPSLRPAAHPVSCALAARSDCFSTTSWFLNYRSVWSWSVIMNLTSTSMFISVFSPEALSLFHCIYPALSLTEESTMKMEAWLLLLSSCSSWCTQRRWWKTRPQACLCWRLQLQIQMWELMARSPTLSTVPTLTSSISTTGQVRWCLGSKHECFL